MRLTPWPWNKAPGFSSPIAPCQRKLERAFGDRLPGVARWFANHLGTDPAVVRIALILGTIISGATLFLYLAAWLIVPQPEQNTRVSIGGPSD